MSELSTVPILPLDIIENIVDILKNDAKGLQYVKAFSLTCQSFLPFCRKHIFSTIGIKIGNSSIPTKLRTGEAFEQLLLGTPAIAKYVRQLNIRIMQKRHSCSGYSFDQVSRQMTGLQFLIVSLWHQPPTYSYDWNHLSSSLQRSLLNLMHLPTLSHLGLETIRNFPISNITTCTNLKHLSVANLHITAEYDEASSSLLYEPMQLQALDIDIRCSETLILLPPRYLDGQPVLDFSGLEKISIRFDCGWRDAAVPTREIFRKAQRLTDICMKVDVDDTDFRAMQFAKMVTPSLQTLRRIEWKFGSDNGLNDDLLVGLCDELEDISGKNNLESIEIQIYVDTDDDCHTGAEWGRLEKVLLKSGWPMLTHVSLAIVLNSWSKRRIDSPFGMALKSLPQTQFTSLMSSKNLDFRFSVEELRF